MLPMGVASCSLGRDGREEVCRDKAGSCGVPLTGLALGDGGMARPNRGVRKPLFPRLPGIGGLSRGAGDDMLRFCEEVTS